MWRYRYTDEIYHGDHKYIAKIGKGKDAKYFYTQEALNAYKRALSSKDEKEKFIDVTGTPERTPNGLRVNQLATARVRSAIARGTANAQLEKGSGIDLNNLEKAERYTKAENAYDEARTLKGKAKAVDEVHKEIKAEKNAVKAEKRQQRQEKINAYKNALSSKDEKAALNKAVKNERATVDDIHKIDDGEIRDLKNAIKNLDGKDLKKQLSDLTKKGAEKQTAEARAKTEGARKAYVESQTLRGKAKALAEVHKSYNPESAAKFEKLEDYKNAVSSKDEKAALDKAVKNEREKYDDLLNVDSTERKNLLKARLKRDEQAIKKHSQDVTAEGKEKQIKEARAKTKAAEKAYAESKTVKNKAKAVAETYKKYNPETAARIQNGKNYLDELFKKKRR